VPSRELKTVSFYRSRRNRRELSNVDTETDVVACPAFLGGVLASARTVMCATVVVLIVRGVIAENYLLLMLKLTL